MLMKAGLINQQSSDTKYCVRYVDRFAINLSAKQIDLHKWITEMTESDYLSYSPAHIAMNSYFKDGMLFMTNVENICTDLVVQHYELKFCDTAHVQLYSARSDAYILRWVPVIVGVPWEMQISPTSTNTCELVCLIGADYPNLFLKAAAWLNGLGGWFFKKHLSREGRAFAKDIEQKFRRG